MPKGYAEANASPQRQRNAGIKTIGRKPFAENHEMRQSFAASLKQDTAHKKDKIDVKNPADVDVAYPETRDKYHLKEKMRESVARLHWGVPTPEWEVTWERPGAATVDVAEDMDHQPARAAVTPERLRNAYKTTFNRWNRHGVFLNLYE